MQGMKGSHANTDKLRDAEEVSAQVVDCGYKLHVEAGPGLLETVYEVVMAKMLQDRGLRVRRQIQVPIRLMGLRFDEGFRADLLVEEKVLVELKSVEALAPVHCKQVLTYLRLLDLPLGLLLNFGARTFRESCRRIVNGPQSFVASRLRVRPPRFSRGWPYRRRAGGQARPVTRPGRARLSSVRARAGSR